MEAFLVSLTTIAAMIGSGLRYRATSTNGADAAASRSGHKSSPP
jgi:hypothetical protein